MDFPDLYKEHFSYAWKTLRRMGVLERDLPDVAHDLFVVVFRRLPEFDAGRPIKPWLFGIAFRVVSDYRRLGKFKREVLKEAPDITDQAPRSDEQVANSQARKLVKQALDAMEIDRRAVFILHELDGLPVPEIATTLAIPLGTAYSRLRLAREDMAATVKRLRAREEGAR